VRVVTRGAAAECRAAPGTGRFIEKNSGFVEKIPLARFPVE